jgi:hypothetical protein
MPCLLPAGRSLESGRVAGCTAYVSRQSTGRAQGDRLSAGGAILRGAPGQTWLHEGLRRAGRAECIPARVDARERHSGHPGRAGLRLRGA